MSYDQVVTNHGDTSVSTVSFTQMRDGTRADYDLLARFEHQYVAELPDRILAALRLLDSGLGGYPVSRLEHSLQSATRAHRDGRDEEYVVAALLHDVGDGLAPFAHDEMAAAILKPYVREEVRWIIQHHGLFQTYYYNHHYGRDRNGRERFRDHQYFDACAEFCERYDQNCFDPEYESLPLSYFEPMLRRVFAEARYLA